MIEEPELFLHPTLQRVAGEILYRLSRKNQVVFTTHSPNLLANFNSREIRQVVLDKQGRSIVRDNTDISVILDDLGYTATDLMNVNFVFIVEGKQDKNRLPILLKDIILKSMIKTAICRASQLLQQTAVQTSKHMQI